MSRKEFNRGGSESGSKSRGGPESESESKFIFFFRHPKNGCYNDGEIIEKTFSAANNNRAKVLAEQEVLICEGCKRDYDLIQN